MKTTTCRTCKHGESGPRGSLCRHPEHIITIPDIMRGGAPVQFPQSCVVLAARMVGDCPHHEEESEKL
jgi:hypothetical protein